VSKPPRKRDRGEQDLFCLRFDQIIDMHRGLVALSRKIDWAFLEG